jgi:protein SCO1/2
MTSRLSVVFLMLTLLTPARPVSSDTYRGGSVSPPLPKPHFVLTDTSGARFDFWDRTFGSVTLLFFGYTSCPDQCPMHVANVASALRTLPPDVANHVKFVFVTTDPSRDTKEVLRRWLDQFDTRFVGLTGTESALAAVQKAAGVPAASRRDFGTSYSVGHANFVVAYTRDNRAHVIYPGGISASDWVHDLPLLLKEAR